MRRARVRPPCITRSASIRPEPAHAFALGLVHGPCELLPVSSSAHLALVPWLADWPERALDPELRKALEVAAHAGTGAALVLARGRRRHATRRAAWRPRSGLMLGAVAVPGAVGAAFERPIERHLGSPASIAAGLLVGALVMTLCDRQRAPTRTLAQAGPRDGLFLGLAQAVALVPGVSRNGATLAAARARGFGRADAAALSATTGLPVVAGAVALKGWRLVRRPSLGPGISRALGAAAAGAFVSTVVCDPLARASRRGWPLAPFAVYRCLLSLLVIRRLGENDPVTGSKNCARGQSGDE
jgi:undecaprenyl-diphosphatase